MRSSLRQHWSKNGEVRSVLLDGERRSRADPDDPVSRLLTSRDDEQAMAILRAFPDGHSEIERTLEDGQWIVIELRWNNARRVCRTCLDRP